MKKLYFEVVTDDDADEAVIEEMIRTGAQASLRVLSVNRIIESTEPMPKKGPLGPFSSYARDMEFENTIRDMVAHGEKIKAIKKVMSECHKGLREAKDYVDNL